MDLRNRSESQSYPRASSLVVAALLGFALVRILQPFAGPILWRLLLAFLLFPVNARLRRTLGGREGTAGIIVTIGVDLLWWGRPHCLLPRRVICTGFLSWIGSCAGLSGPDFHPSSALGPHGGVIGFSLIGLVLGPVVNALVLALVRFVEESQRKIRQLKARVGPG